MRKHNLMIVFLLSLLCFSFITPIYSAFSQSTGIPISSQGRVVYDGHYGLTLKYSTDFENVVKTDEYSLNLTIPNYIYTQGDGGARVWIEGLDTTTLGITPHSGSRCLGLEVTDLSLSRRAQLDVYIGQYAPLTGDEYYFKGWYFLPPDWTIDTSDEAVVAGNYYSIANPFSNLPSFNPIVEIELHPGRVGNTWDGTFDLAVTYRGDKWYPDWSVYDNFPWMALRGRWFPIEWYVKMHDTAGIVKVWVDSVLVCDKSGVALPKDQGPYIVIGKVYYGTMDPYSKQLWVDDLEIYGAP